MKKDKRKKNQWKILMELGPSKTRCSSQALSWPLHVICPSYKKMMHTAINNIESESGNPNKSENGNLIESESGSLIESESGNLIESESPENAGTKNSSTALRQHIKNRPDQPDLERSKLTIVKSKDAKYGLVSLEPFLPASKPMVTAGLMWQPDMCPGQKIMII